MNTKQKSLEIAKMMGWYIYTEGYAIDMGYTRGEQLCIFEGCDAVLEPYLNLAQFAAILLKFPEVIDTFVFKESEDGVEYIARRSELFTQEISLMQYYS